MQYNALEHWKLFATEHNWNNIPEYLNLHDYYHLYRTHNKDPFSLKPMVSSASSCCSVDMEHCIWEWKFTKRL